MKKFIIFFLVNSFFAKTASSFVTGFVYLNNQIDNSGIQVKFLPQSGTAILDSTLTLADGSYSMSLSGGLYKVLYSRQGYQDLYYQNSNSVAIAANDILQSVTLYPGTVKYVSGNVSGVWSSDTIYIATDTVRVLQGTTLTIQPGTTVKVYDNLKFVVVGTLNAIGTDSQQIVFTSATPNPVPGSWTGFECPINSTINASFCLFEYAQTCIYSEQANVTVANSELRYFRNGGIYCFNRSPRIFNTNFHSYRAGAEDWTWGVYVTGFSLNAFISCNTFNDGKGYGIIIDGEGVVQNNIIRNINNSSRGNGISIRNSASPIITNNYITNCEQGISIGDNSGHPNAVIVNNTITNCIQHGIWFNGNHGQGKLINNILFNNPIALKGSANCSICKSEPDVVLNTIFWNNSQNFNTINIAGIGQIVNTNSNGDAIDSYFNLFQDPEYVTGNEPELISTSPAINAGDTTYSFNIGFSPDFVCDTMAIVSAIPYIGIINTSIFPNPASDNITVQINNSNGSSAELIMVDFTGAVVIKKTITKSLTIDLKKLSAGLYFVSIINANRILTQKLLVTH